MFEETAIKFCRLCNEYSDKIFRQHGDYHRGTRDELVPRDEATRTAMNSLESAINSEDTLIGRDDALNEALAACRDCDYKLPLIADILLGTKEEKRTIKIGPGIVDLSRPSSANNEPTEAPEDIENTTNQAAQIYDTTLTSYLSRKRAEGSYQSEIYNPEPTEAELRKKKEDESFNEILTGLKPNDQIDKSLRDLIPELYETPDLNQPPRLVDTPLDDILGTKHPKTTPRTTDGTIDELEKKNQFNRKSEDASGDTLMNIDADILFGETEDDERKLFEDDDLI